MRASATAAYYPAVTREGRGRRPRSRSGETRPHTRSRLALCLLAPAAAAAQTRYAELSVAVPGTPGVHTSAVRRAPFAFDLLGARWQARPGVSVEARARAFDGRWSAWTSLEADGGGRVSHAEPVWVKGSDALQLRVRGAVRARARRARRGRPEPAAPRPRPGRRAR